MSIKQRAANALFAVIGWIIFRASARNAARAERDRATAAVHPNCRCAR
jgi:hypothetical protein